MTNRRSKKVLAAMSGGVDSSVAAALLKQKGYDVVGITLDIWPSRPGRFAGCCSASAVDDAKSVADKLGIPHYVLNFRDVFKEFVIDDFISQYSSGKTPNPCVRCNQYIKFDRLIKKADELGAEFVATGHYAMIKNVKKRWQLQRSPDKLKDQSYFLYPISQSAMPRILFPVGSITKTRTRQIARALGLKVADKKDSQEICFVEDNNYGRFLSENIEGISKPGPIFDTDGNRVGMHRGIAFYTIGQRRGIGLPFGKPFYVVSIDKDSNSIVVGDEKATFGKELFADNLVWTSIDAPAKPFNANAKIRYASEESPATVIPAADGKVLVKFKRPVKSITPGQSVVFYNKNIVLGGGIICSKS
ncbi:MAG: tRNA 2-thiouridine(34) synthase MnmA [Candidatus Saganbacteria bacterium]|nr:tRNA 2-thiouridine(34) synthase MnmA [Candidatus Saganbacteria bacterium]